MTPKVETASKSIRKILFPVALALLIAITIDMNIGSTVDIVKDFAISFYGVMLFTVVAIASIIGQYFVIKMIRGLNKEKELRRRNIDILETIVTAVQYVLAGIIVIVLIQIIFTAHYYTHLLSAAATISYGLAVYLMSALAYWFLSWYRRNRSLVVLLYALSAIFITINAVDTIVFYDVILTHKSTTISPQSEVIWETDFNPTNPMFIVSTLHAISLNCYFILAWGGTILLLRHNIKRIGRVKFWALITTPLLFFMSFYVGFYQALNPPNPTPILASLLLPILLVNAGIQVGGILFGTGFRSIARSLTTGTIGDYMIITAYGFVMYFTAAAASVLQAGYPPYGLIAVSFVGPSAYFILVGLYRSTISIAQDTKLRHSIRKSIIAQSKLLDSISTAHMEQELENRVIKIAKEASNSMSEETGVHLSLTEDDMKQYLAQLLLEFKPK